MLIGSINTVVK